MNDLTKLYETISRNDFKGIIAISGQSCSGKTTLANTLVKMFSEHNPCIIHQDDYFKDIKDVLRNKNGYKDMENMQAFCVNEFKQDIVSLVNGQNIYVPNYDILSNTRLDKSKKLIHSELIIVEGLHAVLLVKDLNLRIFVYSILLDESVETCIQRRVIRDCSIINVTPERVRLYFENVILDNYKDYLKLIRIYANEVIKDGFCKADL